MFGFPFTICPAEIEQLTNTWRHIENFDLVSTHTVTSVVWTGRSQMSGENEQISGSKMSSSEIIDRFMRLRIAWSKLFAVRAFISLANSCNHQVRLSFKINILKHIKQQTDRVKSCSWTRSHLYCVDN